MKGIDDLRDVGNYQSLNNASGVNVSKLSLRFLIRRDLIYLVIFVIAMSFTYFFKDNIANKLQNYSIAILNYISDKLISCGFSIDEIVIIGNKFVDSSDITKLIDSDKSILFISLSELQKKIKNSNQWIKNVTVRRLLPDVLQVKVIEYSPFANWYHDYGNSIIDETGYVIVDDYDEQDDLISIYGDEALTNLHFIRKLVNDDNVLSSMISSVFCLNNGYLDIVLSSGLKIQLPKENPDHAWNDLLRIYEASNEFLIWKTVDMRIPSQISIIK